MMKLVSSLEKINQKVNTQSTYIDKIRRNASISRSTSRPKFDDPNNANKKNLKKLRTDVRNSYQYLAGIIKEVRDKQGIMREK